MILGQLYHYLHTLDQIKLPVELNDIPSLAFFGLSKLPFEEFSDLNQEERQQKIRDLFSKNYIQVLVENKLDFSLQFWKLLTSPNTQQNLNLKAKTEFQAELLEWAKNDFQLNYIPNLLKIGELSSQEEDVAIFYGLKVLSLFSDFTKNSESYKIDQDLYFKEAEEVSNEVEILVFTNNLLAPLFKNLNCLVDSLPQENKEVLERIKYWNNEFPSIKLVLIEGTDKDELINFLQRMTSNSLLVTSINLNLSGNKNQPTFFDRLVKQTLGVRLP